MSTVTLTDIELDYNDQGIQWIPGIGFRPIDMSEELPGNNLFCGQNIDSNMCTENKCSHGKGSHLIIEKWDMFDSVFWTPYTPATYKPILPIPTTQIPTIIPPIIGCCIIVTHNPKDPFTPKDPSPVPIPAGFMLLATSLVFLGIIQSLIKGINKWT